MLSVYPFDVVPRVHCITNYVTAGDCANMLLACGAAPIMADDPKESAVITARCDALVINTGTLHEHTIPAMLASGQAANAKGIPVILDPVGIGSSGFRRETVFRLLEKIRFSVIRGNQSEIRVLAGLESGFSGVDVGSEIMTANDLLGLAADCSEKIGSVIAITGKTDTITDGKVGFRVHNGSPRITKVTGAGCMLSAITGAYCAVNPKNILQAAASAFFMYGMAAELAAAKTQNLGIGSFRTALFDAVELLHTAHHNLDTESRANYEIIQSIPVIRHHRPY